MCDAEARIAELEAERDALKKCADSADGLRGGRQQYFDALVSIYKLLTGEEDANRPHVPVIVERIHWLIEENALLRKALEQIAGTDKPDTVPAEFRDYWLGQSKDTSIQIARAVLARIPEAK